jgi:hypothetical protein
VSKVTHHPACLAVLTNDASLCNCIKPGPSKKEIDAEARRIHKCPEHYDGPCWGATEEDRHQAYKNLTESK